MIAPAGAGKTTALRVLADTWTAGGGHILGLAPSAAAAAQLAEATGIQADTLARLIWAIDHHHPAAGVSRPDRSADAAAVSPRTAAYTSPTAAPANR